MSDEKKPDNGIELPDGTLDTSVDAPEPEQATESTDEVPENNKPVEGIVASRRKLRELLHPSEFVIWARYRKALSLPLIIVIVIAVLMLIPLTRYKLTAWYN